MADRPKIAFIGTGGTISSIGEGALDILDYAATDRRLDAGAIVESIPELADVADVIAVAFREVPSPAIGFTEWRELVLLCKRLVAEHDDSPASSLVTAPLRLKRRRTP